MKTNEEIRMAAQAIYRQFVSASYNDNYGEDDGTMNICCSRMIKAKEWAKGTGEYDTMKQICGQMFTKAGQEMRKVADECFQVIFG